MGCLHSKKETTDLHPNVFRVVNIDENGVDLCSAQLEITETDIILYREGRDSTVWPLHSLRRYGFEAEIFSFESGRRCETGEGIYAFRCRRASLLFRNLQQQIQIRNVIHDVPYPVSRLTGSPSPQTRQTLQASVVHRSSIDNGIGDVTVVNNNINNMPLTSTVRPMIQSPRSPSSADILEVMPLYPRSQTNGSHVTNVYQLRDFKREHNNNQDLTADSRHVYSNDINKDLAILRNSLHQESAFNNIRDIQDETNFLESMLSNTKSTNFKTQPLSPTLSNCSEQYAQLSMEQQQPPRLYMNLFTNKNITSTEKSDPVPGTPLTPKPVEYCNLNVGPKQEIVNSYANLALGDIVDGPKNFTFIKQKNTVGQAVDKQKVSESDTFGSISPVEDLDINYAILDIDSHKEVSKINRDVTSPENLSYNSSKNESTGSCTSHSRGRLVSQTSLEKQTGPIMTTAAPLANIGYTTIDFDKTVALTSVAAGNDVDMEGPRKTRHDSCNILCNSPSSSDKLKSN